MEERLDRLENRVSKLEEWRGREETRAAVAMEQSKHLDRRFDQIDRELGEIKGAFWKATWIVLGAVLLAATTFVLRGGLVGG